MMSHLETGTLNLDKISKETLEDLVSRAAISSVPDGFGSNSRLSDSSRGGNAGVRVKDEHGEWETVPVTGVEATMFARESPPKDELSSRVKHIEKLLIFIDVAANEIQTNITEIHRVEEEKKQRIVSTPCLICSVNPSEKAGYCTACYKGWHNHGSPDRLKWELFKKQITNVDGLILVAECPPPRAGKTARLGPHRTQNGNSDLTKQISDV